MTYIFAAIFIRHSAIVIFYQTPAIGSWQDWHLP
jgi:hypothetical protein